EGVQPLGKVGRADVRREGVDTVFELLKLFQLFGGFGLGDVISHGFRQVVDLGLYLLNGALGLLPIDVAAADKKDEHAASKQPHAGYGSRSRSVTGSPVKAATTGTGPGPNVRSMSAAQQGMVAPIMVTRVCASRQDRAVVMTSLTSRTHRPLSCPLELPSSS